MPAYLGACALLGFLAASCAADAYSGEPTPGTIPGFGSPQGDVPPAAGGSSNSNSGYCPTYQSDFLPRVHAPVCSNCHGSDPKLRNWGVYSQALGGCGLIGSVVAGGSMPPRSSGLSLTADQRALVAEWVSLGCPESENTLPANCGSGSGNANSGGAQPAPTTPAPTPAPIEPGEDSAPVSPGTTSGIVVTRARWDSETSTLDVEGAVYDPTATLRVDFGGRSETIANDAGRFGGDFVGVVVYPPTVTVTASTGATATSPVEAH